MTESYEEVRENKVETKEQKIRKLEKSTANNHGSFSIGLFSTALLVYSTSEGFWWVGMVVVGAIFALSSLYFLFLNYLQKSKKRQKFIEVASYVKINHIEWFLGLVPFGIGLLQIVKMDWAVIIGIASITVGYIVLVFGICTGVKAAINEINMNKLSIS